MSLVSWDPFRELDDMLNRFGRIGGGVAVPGRTGEVVSWRPAANISETDKEYIIKAELPEVKKEDIEVAIDDGVLTIKGERRLEKRDENEKQHRIESFYGSFARSFTLPSDADEEHIEAESKDGVLTVRIPKVPAATPKRVEVKVG
ncbi:MAG: Hsp20/alpha crystallin family protein [Gammaproteobacteria bacterium]|nr:MAG: Hsp20/alpha crystallin family protein [Gammaproteobacteria bacterium]